MHLKNLTKEIKSKTGARFKHATHISLTDHSMD